ncbi:MAG: lantibiotic protection ABC transporter ATP-binding protein [Lachnospiraceae bacterium]
MDLILKTTALCKSFKGQPVVKNVSLEIERNSVYGLLGPNGAGKSTILKMVSGMLNPSSGLIEFNGHKWEREDLKKTGALIEQPPIYENLSAEENLEVKRLMLGLPRKRIKEALEMAGLTGTGRKKAGQFSMGMKQRLGIALALLNNPELLILDEPLNGLDPLGIQELRKLTKSFPLMGITVIFSSHILNETSQVADHIGIISDGFLGYSGRINKDDNLEEIFLNVVKAGKREVAAC